MILACRNRQPLELNTSNAQAGAYVVRTSTTKLHAIEFEPAEAMRGGASQVVAASVVEPKHFCAKFNYGDSLCQNYLQFHVVSRPKASGVGILQLSLCI